MTAKENSMNPIFQFALAHPTVEIKVSSVSFQPENGEGVIRLSLRNTENDKKITRLVHRIEYSLYELDDVSELFLNDMYEQIKDSMK